MSDSPVVSPMVTDEQVRQVNEVREAAARQKIEVRLHPAAGFVEIEVREKYDLSSRRVFVPIITWEVVFGSLLQLRHAAAGVVGQLTQTPPRT